ncbi:hypothetical protein HMPREF1487_09656 [Pseudomonas sp. HPB0071]|nr:hypothetical protein HMPREF1487_09656 [Pseudomonas sp. HPB0071]
MMKMMEVDLLYTFIIAGIIFITAWVISNIPSHPILYLFKYRFYKVESDDGMVYILISNRKILSPKSITSVKKISDGMLME